MPKPHPADQRPIIRELVTETEAVRQKRQFQWREGNHPENKRFSQEELRDLACPSYKHLLLGNTQRLPSRALVLQIADYLECTIHETNDLLLAAQYLPEVVELRTDEEQAALAQAEAIVQMLPLPAMVVAHGFHLHFANQHYLNLVRLPSVASLSYADRMVLRFFFDPDHALYQPYHPTTSEGVAGLHNMVRIYKTQHRPFRREAWLREQVHNLHSFPEFERYHQFDYIPHEQILPEGVSLVSLPLLDMPIQQINIAVRIRSTLFPYIHIGFPNDDATHYAYQQIGCPISDNRWQNALCIGSK